MSDFLLTTKTHIPPLRSHLVNRPQLIQRLNDGIIQKHRLILLSAPAGYGKSTLLSEWVSQLDDPAAWLSLEKGENSPARFWSYFVSALHTIPSLRQLDLGRSILQAMRSRRPPPLDELLANLVNDFSLLEENVILVLDDLHTITENTIHEGLEFLIEHLPVYANSLRLIVASRMDPPWPLARWRVRNELTEVRSKDLRFSTEEVHTFLDNVMEHKLANRDIIILEQRTEGWVAGLQMAALSMESRGDVAGFLEGFSGTHRFVLDYLLEEVLSQQTPEALNFLLRTSFLEHLTAPLCDAITDSKDSQAILDQLEASNMFLVPLDDERQWYRYHHLFSDMLQSRLKKIHPEIIPAIHAKACTWYTQNGFIPKALMHAVAANNLDCLVKLVENYAFTIFDVDEASTFLSWLSSLPDRVMGSSPWLHIAQAWLLAYLGQVELVKHSILAAEKYADPTDRRLMGYIEAMWTLLAELNYPEIDASPHVTQALELLPQTEYRPRGFVAYHYSNILAWRGDLLLALKYLENANTWSLAAGDSELAMIAQFQKSSILYSLGRLTESLEAFERTFRMVASNYPDKRTQSLPVGFAYLQLSSLYLEWNRIPEALRYANEGIQICRSWGYSDYLYNGLSILADVLLVAGDLNEALKAIREAKQLFEPPILDRVNALEAAIQLAMGDLASASEWADKCSSSLKDIPEYEYRAGYIHLATILQAQGRMREAYNLLERIKGVLEKAGAKTPLLEVCAQQTIILKKLKEDDQAFASLSGALLLGKSEGHIRPFRSKGIQMADLLREALNRGIETHYIQQLLTSFEPQQGITPFLPITHPIASSASLIEPLSDREVQVLRLLDSRLNNEEIGRELYVSVNTIRTHIRNIYSKLGVNRRREAIGKAKELKLI